MSCLDHHDVIRNRYTVATSVFGGISLILCLLILVVIVSYRKTGVSLRDRILAGLFVANAIYSFGNLVPVEYDACTRYGSLPGLNRLGTFSGHRALWFAGKYMIVSYEMFIMGASVVAFRVGVSSWSVWKEVAAHCTCVGTGLVSFIVFMALTVPTERSRRRAKIFVSVQNLTDSEKEQWMSLVHEADARYNDIEKTMIQTWLGFLVVALILWITSRMYYWYTVRQWRQDYVIQQRQWDRDLWAPENASQLLQKHRLVQLQREAYANIARPLEPYVAVFVVFAIPAIVMSTDYCQRLTDHNGHCFDPCVMVLALRSVATAVVYFVDPLRRSQLLNCTRLWQGCVNETGNCCMYLLNCCNPKAYTRMGRGVRFNSVLFQRHATMNQSVGTDGMLTAMLLSDTVEGAPKATVVPMQSIQPAAVSENAYATNNTGC
eukprot:m.290021 g.290021  ORF g.290021 m.290021 type:complete len:433 (-) comp19974_c2_seq8:1565-2863(-)